MAKATAGGNVPRQLWKKRPSAAVEQTWTYDMGWTVVFRNEVLSFTPCKDVVTGCFVQLQMFS